MRSANERSKKSTFAQVELARRPMEIDALYTVPLKIAHTHGVKTPTLDILVELVKLRAGIR